ALQDQAFELAPALKYAPGDGDRVAAVHSLIEGDATSAMLDVVAGSAFKVGERELRTILAASTALSTVGVTTPRVLQESLTAPYSDGFAFVQDRRRRGGFVGVDAAFRAPPDSTEQILHPEKYEVREAPIVMAVPPTTALGPDFRAVYDDVMGEQ